MWKGTNQIRKGTYQTWKGMWKGMWRRNLILCATITHLCKIMAMISNNVIPDKNRSTIITLSPIPETYPEEAVGTTSEAVELLISGIMDTD